MENNTSKKSLTTIVRAFDVVTFVKSKDGARVSEVAKGLDLPKSTVYNHLTTLHQMGYLTKEGDEYQVGLRFLWLGGYAATRKEMYQMARPKVVELAEETNERAQFIVEEHGQAIYLHQETGAHAVQTDVRLGKQTFLHTTSAGKAILARMPEQQVEDIIERWGLPARTENTITDKEALFAELDTIREHGVGFNRQERIKGQHAVGVPVTDTEDRVVGALSVSGPAHRLTGDWLEQGIPELLLGTANELELNIAYA